MYSIKYLNLRQLLDIHTLSKLDTQSGHKPALPHASMRKSRRYSKKRKGVAFDQQNQTPVEHHQFGVWDLYIERDPKLSYFPKSWRIGEYSGLLNDLPYLWRTVCDLRAVTWPLLFLFVVIALVQSLIPALSLWCVDCTCGSFSDTLDN